VTAGGRQPRLMLLAGAQRAPGFFVVDFPGQSARVADLCSTLYRCFLTQAYRLFLRPAGVGLIGLPWN
jgi:hypothetical protein